MVPYEPDDLLPMGWMSEEDIEAYERWLEREELLQREELAQRREVSQVIELRFPNYGRQTVLARQIVGCSIRWHWRSLVTRTRRHRVRLKTVWATYDVVLPYDEADELYREIRAALEAHETVEKYGG